MLTYEVVHQARYSRGQLLLRTFLGLIYIAIPHYFLLLFLSIAAAVLIFLSWWAVLFTGRYPRSFFDFVVSLYRWEARVEIRLLHLTDGYPAFGLNATDASLAFDIPYPERLGRWHLLLRTLFGWLYCAIPHGFILLFRGLATMVLVFLAWWAVLFAGKYPKSWHDFNVGTLRWNWRLNAYMLFLSDTYPPFSGKP